MKTIQWFPGHMTAAMRMMEKHLSIVDGVVFVLDARCPAASFNQRLKRLAGAKPVLYVLNKGDLADERADILLKKIRDKGAAAIKINAVNSGSRRDISFSKKIYTEKLSDSASDTELKDRCIYYRCKNNYRHTSGACAKCNTGIYCKP